MSVQTASPTKIDPATKGFVCGLLCYILWGLLPLYMKAVAHISTFEVLAHRALWSIPIAAAALYFTNSIGDVKAAVRSPRTLGMAALTATIIAMNWGIYVWAIAVDRVVETALGYYINPLITVVIGALLLGERLDRIQMIAVALAAVAVLVLTIEAGGVPWVSLGLAITFAAYGYLRKTLPIGAAQGFFLEVALMSPFALAYLIWIRSAGTSHFGPGATSDSLLLMLAGPITAVPLLLYAFGAKALRISTIGIMQYISPTIVALIAVFVFHEPFGVDRAIAFGLIWVALALYTWSLMSKRRRDKAAIV